MKSTSRTVDISMITTVPQHHNCSNLDTAADVHYFSKAGAYCPSLSPTAWGRGDAGSSVTIPVVLKRHS